MPSARFVHSDWIGPRTLSYRAATWSRPWDGTCGVKPMSANPGSSEQQIVVSTVGIVCSLEPGFGLIGFTPHVPAQGLDHVAAKYDSVRGPIQSEWTKRADGIDFHVIVPPTARGRMDLPCQALTSVRVVHGSGDTTGVAVGDAPGITGRANRGWPRAPGLRVWRLPVPRASVVERAESSPIGHVQPEHVAQERHQLGARHVPRLPVASVGRDAV